MASLNGREIADTIKARVREGIAASGITPGLAVILVGDDPASHLYVQLKAQAAADVGIHFERTDLPATTSEDVIIERVRQLNERDDIHGVVIQLPLPEPLNQDRILDALLPRKDVDGFHPDNVRELLGGDPVTEPALVRSIFALLEEASSSLEKLHTVVVAREGVFTKVLEYLLHQHGAQVTTVAPEALTPADTSEADVLIVAVGQPKLITADHVKDGAIVIDIGINPQEGGGVVGDVDFAGVAAKAAWITPVPGGVGPVTVATLLQNVYDAAKRQVAPPLGAV